MKFRGPEALNDTYKKAGGGPSAQRWDNLLPELELSFQHARLIPTLMGQSRASLRRGWCRVLTYFRVGSNTNARMYAPRNRAPKIVGIVFYGLVAGFAATVAIVLGPIFLGLLAGWIFNQLGWEQASKSVAFSGLYYIYFTGAIGLIVGVIVCLCVWITRLRNAPTP